MGINCVERWTIPLERQIESKAPWVRDPAGAAIYRLQLLDRRFEAWDRQFPLGKTLGLGFLSSLVAGIAYRIFSLVPLVGLPLKVVLACVHYYVIKRLVYAPSQDSLDQYLHRKLCCPYETCTAGMTTSIHGSQMHIEKISTGIFWGSYILFTLWQNPIVANAVSIPLESASYHFLRKNGT